MEKSAEDAMYQRACCKVIQASRFDNKSTQEEQEGFLRSILEADQEEDNEEAEDMNDEELKRNELIARHDSEALFSARLDAKRERDTLESWRAQGNRGKPPQPLMQFEGLPECYQADEPFEVKESDDVVEGRGQHRRNVVSYNDGLSDDAWAMALEEGEDLQELAERARERKDRRLQNKLLREAEASGRNTLASDVDGRGRKPKKGKAKTNDYEPSASSKRKRGMKSLPVTPELDDDDEDHDPKRRKTKANGNSIKALTFLRPSVKR